MKKCLDDASGCLTFGGASLGQCTEGVQCWSVAQRGGDGWVILTEMLSRHTATWFHDVQLLDSRFFIGASIESLDMLMFKLALIQGQNLYLLIE